MTTKHPQDQVFNERNTLMIALARTMLMLGHQAGFGVDQEKRDFGWNENWSTVVYIDLPDGKQLSYHMNDDTAAAARTLPLYPGKWDGGFTGREVPDWLISMRDVQSLPALREREMIADIQAGNAPPPDWMRIAVFNEMKERLQLPDGDEAAIGPWETLHELNLAAHHSVNYANPGEKETYDDGIRFRRLLKLFGEVFKHEQMDDAGPHPAATRAKEIAGPIVEAMGDENDPTIVLEGMSNILRDVLDQLHEEGFAP